MKKALLLAKKAAKRGEIPVGALIVHSKTNTLVSFAYNLRENLHTPLAHAELLAIHRASLKNKSWRLNGHTLYVTLEPCIMCSGAIIQSRMDRLVYGANDPKGGGTHSLYRILSDSRTNHQTEYMGEVLENSCSLILKKFFKDLRLKNKAKKLLPKENQ